MASKALFLGQQGHLDPDHLTTHAVCLGMTGSGKTGLGIVALEELARRSCPLLIVDLKGDMVNLLLNFPDLEARDFQEWLTPDLIAGRDPLVVAREQAELWTRGLAREGLGRSEIDEVQRGLLWQLVTPGVSLAPVDILPALTMPEGWSLEHDSDAVNDRVNGLVSALLALIGKGGDPLTDRDHVLLASIILEHWRRGESLDFVGLLNSIAQPPLERLGALPLETFYDRDDRMKLVMQLNTLIASPAFAAWTRGTPLAMEHFLGSSAEPRATIVSVAHLDERQRQFVLALLTSELVAWMRRQPASSGLRALLYIDEVQGILPPHPANPPTKAPLLTLLKQGRAFGVGAWLATQNPVDLDYKALGNAGVKIVGRLITDRDRDRALEGLDVQEIDGRDADELVAGLGKREFVLYDVRAEPRVSVFSSRWAISYLRGPITLPEMEKLVDGQGADAPPATDETDPRSESQPTSPPLMESRPVQRFNASTSGLAAPEVHLHCRFSIERRTLDLYREIEEWWRIPVGDTGALDFEQAAQFVREELDLLNEAPPGMVFPETVPTAFDNDLEKLGASFVKWRARQRIPVLGHEKLKMSANAGESREDFIERCLEAADKADDTRQERVRSRFEKKIERLKARLEREQDELDRDRVQLQSRQAEEKLGVVEGLFSVLLGSKSLRTAAGKAASKARSAATKRRMRQRAEASVVESQNEIERIAADIEDLGLEMQDEIDAIAAESEELAEMVDEVMVKATQSAINVIEFEVVWS